MTMPRFVYSETVDQAARVLFAKHKVSVDDRYGKCTASGYVVDESSGGVVRVSHRMPEPDLLDDDRMGDDEMAAERHRLVDAYAKTLEAAGYTVERRGPRSRKPYLIASPAAPAAGDGGGRIVADRNSDRPGVLLCREHGDGWMGLTPLTSEDLPDGGICTHGRPHEECGRDVLAED